MWNPLGLQEGSYETLWGCRKAHLGHSRSAVRLIWDLWGCKKAHLRPSGAAGKLI